LKGGGEHSQKKKKKGGVSVGFDRDKSQIKIKNWQKKKGGGNKLQKKDKSNYGGTARKKRP